MSVVKTGDKKSVKNQSPSKTDDASITGFTGNDIVPASSLTSKVAYRLSSRRWRSYVPFLAQYIGQETATETLRRTTRRHSEYAWKAYGKHTSLPPSPRTVAKV